MVPAFTVNMLVAGFVVVSVCHGTVLADEQHEYATLTSLNVAAADLFGQSVSIDGDTLVVGAETADCVAGLDCGAAYVFKFNGNAWIQMAKLTASDAAANDNFGDIVSISGDTIVMGAYSHDCGAGVDCGAAYVFVKPVSGWTNMTQTAKLTVSDAAAFDFFGIGACISGDTVVVGAHSRDCVAGVDCGAGYVFVKPGGGWSDMTQTAKLTASDAAVDDELGQSVSISGDTIVVGAHHKDCGAGGDCGAAYVFVKPGGGWSNMTQTAKLTASDVQAGDGLGYSVAVSGDTIVAGARYDDCGVGGDCGSAYVFVKPGGGWSNMTQTAKLTASDQEGGSNMGDAVSISGDTVVVGAFGKDCAAGIDCGAAYVFAKPVGGWGNMTETTKLTASDAAANDILGGAVSVVGGTIVVGAIHRDCAAGADCGAAYVFGALPILGVPSVSAWGAAVMVLLMACAGTCILIRRRERPAV
ncbi:MAG: FG-GAP repeat protein [Planctomycetes bacterium]|nr:FG-GAP repeat protein [Planctomycetota bacterium]MBI3833435.1 FG-GAP repeat protein [Planctomycetota bacterium]